MLYTPGNEKKEITLQIKTLIIDEEAEDGIAGELEKLLYQIGADEEISLAALKDITEPDNYDEIELCTEATVETGERGDVIITYKENEDDIQISTLSKIIFNPQNPDLVAMTKEGSVGAVLSFEEGKTHVCSYDTPFMPFKVYVTTNKVDNRLLSIGKLKLDYILNLNDTPPQHFIITATAKDAPIDELKELFE